MLKSVADWFKKRNYSFSADTSDNHCRLTAWFQIVKLRTISYHCTFSTNAANNVLTLAVGDWGALDPTPELASTILIANSLRQSGYYAFDLSGEGFLFKISLVRSTRHLESEVLDDLINEAFRAMDIIEARPMESSEQPYDESPRPEPTQA